MTDENTAISDFAGVVTKSNSGFPVAADDICGHNRISLHTTTAQGRNRTEWSVCVDIFDSPPRRPKPVGLLQDPPRKRIYEITISTSMCGYSQIWLHSDGLVVIHGDLLSGGNRFRLAKGEDIIQFMSRVGGTSIAQKFGTKELKLNESVTEIQKEILRLRREREITKWSASGAWFDSIDVVLEEDLHDILEDYPFLTNELLVYGTDSETERFIEVFMPPLKLTVDRILESRPSSEASSVSAPPQV